MSPTLSDLPPGEREAVKVFRALGDPTRLRIVLMLAQQEELGCGDLQSAVGLSAPALSHHVRLLQECGLLAMRRRGQYHFFWLQREQLERLAPGLLTIRSGEGYSSLGDGD